MFRISAFAVVTVASSARDTPVQKVVQLLEDLKAEVESDGTSEATTYDEFATFCKSTTEAKSESITEGQDLIDVTSATMDEKTAKKEEKVSELTKRQGEQEDMTDKLSKTEIRCAKEQAAYEATESDLSKGISGLEGAHNALGGSKGAAAASFLALRSNPDMDRILALADALNLMGSPKRQAAAALLQHKARVDPDDPEYKFHSDGILDTISGLLEDFKKEKESVDAEWAKTKQSCDKTKETLTEDMATNKVAMDGCKSRIDDLEADFAGAKQTLIETEAMLKDDQTYLKDLTERCESRAKDWDQRSQQRSDEVTALAAALEILKKGAVDQEAVNKRAFIQSKPASPRVSFLQVERVKAHAVKSVESAKQLSATDAELKVSRVVDLLRTEGQRLGSSMLASMASKASADPFKKVKELIQKLVERLVAEATAEATKKGFCDTALSKAENDRDYRFADANKLSVKVAGLEAKKDALEEEIDSLTTSLEELRDSLAEATTTRGDEKEENIASLKTAKGGLTAVKEAIAVLKAFYSQGAKADKYHSGELDKAASALVQASPVDEDTQGPGFSGAYKGKQEASSGIVGLLQVILSDFEHTVKTTSAAEKSAAAEHVKFDRTSNMDIASKETKKKLDAEDLKTTNNDIDQSMEDLQTAMDLTDGALKTLEDLKPTCTDTTMSFEDRVKKREEEMAALKKALCILDTDNVESECST